MEKAFFFYVNVRFHVETERNLPQTIIKFLLESQQKKASGIIMFLPSFLAHEVVVIVSRHSTAARFYQKVT